MKRGIVITLVIIGLTLVGFFGYRSYKARIERDLAERRAAAENAEYERKATEAKKRAEAEAEAHRLAAVKAQQEADESARELVRLKAEEAEAEARRRAAEADALTATETRERLSRERAMTEGEARLLAVEREREAAEAEKARKSALDLLYKNEQAKRTRADREAARLASLKRQQQEEARLALESDLLARSIYPTDYKRREHYYMGVDLHNSEVGQKIAPKETPVPAKTQ